MKLNLPTDEETTQLKYRVPISLKAELDALAEQCKKHRLDFGAALAEGLRGIAAAIRQELRAKSGFKVEPNVEPAAMPNGRAEEGKA